MPSPPRERCDADADWAKMSNSLAMLSGGIPMPLSSTAISISEFSARPAA